MLTTAPVRARNASSGRKPSPACALSLTCSGFEVAGMMQVTAGWPSTNFSSSCAQVVQPISATIGEDPAALAPDERTAPERSIHYPRKTTFESGEQPTKTPGSRLPRAPERPLKRDRVWQ